MHWKILIKIFISVFCLFFVLLSVYTSTSSIVYLFLYIGAIVGIIYFADSEFHLQIIRHIRKTHHKDLFLIISLCLAQVAVLIYFSHIPYHFHQDEFITAYISYHLPAFLKISWFGVYPLANDWVSQFPVLFFILQKPVLFLLGPSLESIRISTWPYVILISVYLYLLAKEYFKDRLLSFATVVIFIFLAGNIWISSLGLHFSSSTLFFLASFYYFYLLILRRHTTYAVLCGLFLGASYLSYSSSYIVLPILVLLIILELVHTKSHLPLKYFAYAVTVFLIVALPIILFALTKDNFFTQRVGQVNFLSGSWYDTPTKLKEGQNIINLLIPQIEGNIQSLYTDGIGGTGGYTFGYKALYNIPTISLIIFGILASFYDGFIRRRRFPLYVLSSVILIFIFGMVLTLPIGAFHRTSIGFPLIAIIIVIGLNFILRNIPNSLFKKIIIPAFVILLVISNLSSAIKMIDAEKNIPAIDEVYVGDYINQNVKPGEKVFISAFPQYHLEKELFFRTHNKYTFETNYYETIKPEIANHTVVLLDPPNQAPDLIATFPNGKLITEVNGKSLQIIQIFVAK